MFQVTAFNEYGVCVKFMVESLRTKRNQFILRGSNHMIVINHTRDTSQILLYEIQDLNLVKHGSVRLA